MANPTPWSCPCGEHFATFNEKSAHVQATGHGRGMSQGVIGSWTKQPSNTKHQPISQVGHHPGGVLACPKCGGTGFKAKRSVAGKVAIGLLAPKTQVRCTTCGTTYKRG